MLNDSPALYTIKGVVQALKNDKNSFYFILKAVFVFKISILVLPFWSFRRKSVIRKIRLISEFMTSELD